MVFKSTWRYLPEPLLHLFRYLPGREYTRFRHYLDFVRATAREVLDKSELSGNGKDIMSILLKANRSENPNTRLSDIEVVDQVCEYLTSTSIPTRSVDAEFLAMYSDVVIGGTRHDCNLDHLAFVGTGEAPGLPVESPSGDRYEEGRGYGSG